MKVYLTSDKTEDEICFEISGAFTDVLDIMAKSHELLTDILDSDIQISIRN